ncbi:carbohydrate binding domain-containing protein [Rubellicoccus peritrichatus]|uniref:Carbohydrate binding domain-containing protein n=1 Tax=Rubellicoccus peritrichatus TaxID=3080537 RepID=A0AAQ3L5U8_9BACT|nr:carbohydrate binding domain-containing protein [Puniceicoccus sp. CR14]WOO39611.1 carbohydrate binding domain-containing protein [Puniceicoccus sp. CR14]
MFIIFGTSLVSGTSIELEDRMIVTSPGNGTNVYKSQLPLLEGGKRYHVEALVMRDVSSSLGGLKVSLIAQNPQNTLAITLPVASTGQWSKLITSFQAPADLKTSVISAYIVSSSKGSTTKVKELDIGEHLLVKGKGLSNFSYERKTLYLQPQTTYTFSCDMKRGVNSSVNGGSVAIFHRNGSVWTNLLETTTPLDGQWHSIEATFTTPQVNSGEYYLYIYNKYAAVNSVVELRRDRFDQHVEVVGTGGFEYKSFNLDLKLNRKYDISYDFMRSIDSGNDGSVKLFNRHNGSLTLLSSNTVSKDGTFYPVADSFDTLNVMDQSLLYVYNKYASVGSKTVLRNPVVTNGFDRAFTNIETSHFEHNDAEVLIDSLFTPDVNPVAHGPDFNNERDIYGYKPRFMPGEVYFDRENRPWIRTTYLKVSGTTTIRDNTLPSYIQTLDNDGRWVVYKIEQILRDNGFNNVNDGDVVKSQWSPHTRIISDKAGNTYTLVVAKGKSYLLYLANDSETWKAYALPNDSYAATSILEPTDTYSETASAPLIIRYYGGTFFFIEIDAAGNLTQSNIVDFGIGHSEEPSLNPQHSGAGPATVVTDDYVYVAYCTLESPNGIDDGTPQYFRSYNRTSGQMSNSVFLGFGDNPYTETPDNHNGPSLIVDDAGKLILLSGAHQDELFTYTTNAPVLGFDQNGVDPSLTNSWGSAVSIYDKYQWDAGLTYLGFLKDQVGQDGWCLATRDLSRRDGTMRRTLAIIQNGVELGDIVVPDWSRYSIFYHRLTQDKLGRLFLSYFSFTSQMEGADRDAYINKWPETYDATTDTLSLCKHDPVILVSDDFGLTWRFAKTEDFLNGMHNEIHTLQ